MNAGEQNTITSYGVASYKESKTNLATKSENVLKCLNEKRFALC